MKNLSIICLLFLCSCTFSINQVHTQGEASDVVDEQQKASPQVSPTFSFPSDVLPTLV